jgi:hypothetical protein
LQFYIRGCHPLWPAFPDRSVIAFISFVYQEIAHRLLYKQTPDIEALQPRALRRSLGLGCFAFARHYLRNHGCFIFLWVLRWFTSPRSLHAAMYLLHDNQCSHWLGSPIQKFPDQRMLTPPRDLSQLATSFIAFLSQGIHTRALSSLTIKFTSNTVQKPSLQRYCFVSQSASLRNFWCCTTQVHSNSQPGLYGPS